MLNYVGVDKDQTVFVEADIANIGDVDTPQEVYKLLFPRGVLFELLDNHFLTSW